MRLLAAAVALLLAGEVAWAQERWRAVRVDQTHCVIEDAALRERLRDVGVVRVDLVDRTFRYRETAWRIPDGHGLLDPGPMLAAVAESTTGAEVVDARCRSGGRALLHFTCEGACILVNFADAGPTAAILRTVRSDSLTVVLRTRADAETLLGGLSVGPARDAGAPEPTSGGAVPVPRRNERAEGVR